jgi:type I restriction enzyme R subunit
VVIAVGVHWEARDYFFVKLCDHAVETLLVSEEIKRDFLARARAVDQLYKAILPHESAGEFGQERAVFTVLARKIQSLQEPVDISDIMDAVECLLDKSVSAEGYLISEGGPE